jgi:hypothetical protein
MNLAMILRQEANAIVNGTSTSKTYLVLALSDEETKNNSHGWSPKFMLLGRVSCSSSSPAKDLPRDAVPAPRWPPTPSSIRRPAQPLYEVRAVPLSNIAYVTSRSQKVCRPPASLVHRLLFSPPFFHSWTRSPSSKFPSNSTSLPCRLARRLLLRSLISSRLMMRSPRPTGPRFGRLSFRTR